jgi:hypothetical protein
LHGVLPDELDQAVAFGIGLEHVDGLMKIDLAGRPQQSARLAAQLERLGQIDSDRRGEVPHAAASRHMRA